LNKCNLHAIFYQKMEGLAIETNMETMKNAITDVPGIKVGHATDSIARTGCTVILCEKGAVAGVDVRGSAPGTRETDAIRPMCLIQEAHAILLTGGSAFGLDAAGGVMQYLEERDCGFPTGFVKVPIVPAAVIFDLNIGDPKIRPDRQMGYQACLKASDGKVLEGRVGAGTGATVGKYPGFNSSKGGLGTASTAISSGMQGDSSIIVGALVIVNALGNVVDPQTGQIIAGAKNPETGEFVDIVEQMTSGSKFGTVFTNTTIGVVATNAKLDKEGATKVAQMAHDGLAMAIRPVHTLYDGDTIFALSTGSQRADVTTIGALAAKIVAEAVVRAVK
jgi:L-aminopeptidase/D-esterase-like protein